MRGKACRSKRCATRWTRSGTDSPTRGRLRGDGAQRYTGIVAWRSRVAELSEASRLQGERILGPKAPDVYRKPGVPLDLFNFDPRPATAVPRRAGRPH
jgi:hypothetical protein